MISYYFFLIILSEQYWQKHWYWVPLRFIWFGSIFLIGLKCRFYKCAWVKKKKYSQWDFLCFWLLTFMPCRFMWINNKYIVLLKYHILLCLCFFSLTTVLAIAICLFVDNIIPCFESGVSLLKSGIMSCELPNSDSVGVPLLFLFL